MPIATTRWDVPISGRCPTNERAALLRELRDHYGQPLAADARRHRTRDEMVARQGAISAGEWQDDVHAVGVALKLNDGTGPYAVTGTASI